MAGLPVISNVYRTALNWSHPVLGSAVNVLHFRGAPGSAAGLFTALDANVTNDMWLTTPLAAQIDMVAITPLDGSTATLENTTDGATKWNGSIGGQGMPQVATILKLRTAKRGKSYRGRIFLPWLLESLFSEGVIAPTEAAACQAAWVTFRAAMASSGYTLVVASYKLSTAELVLTSTVEGDAATQRRRMSRLR